MLKSFIGLSLFFGSLFGFDPRPITPFPVLGFYHEQFENPHRELDIWYPVESNVEGVPSDSPWDLFNVAKNAKIASSQILRPVIVISHGYSGNPHQLSWLIRGLVNSGFIVIATQHRDLIDGKAHFNHWQRAVDIRFLIDQFQKSTFAQFADLNKIGIAGFSLGGTTAIWVAGGRSTQLDHVIPTKEFASEEDYVKADEALPTLRKEMMSKDWKEKRIKAAFIMAPAWAWLFDEEHLQKINIPVYIIAAEADKQLVTSKNAGFFAKNIPKASYQTIPGAGGHYLFISALHDRQKQNIDPSLNFLLLDPPSIDRQWIQAQVVEEAVRFFNSAL